MHRARRWRAALGALLLLSGGVAAAPWSEAELVAALAAQRQPRVGFSETKQLSYLDVPLRSEGVLEFRPPDYLRRTVQGASAEDFEIDGDRLRISDGSGARRELALDGYPGLRAFADAFRATLGGDLVTLRRYFTLRLQGERARWTLTLTPRVAELAAQLNDITLSGSDGHLATITVRERNGDSTVTQLRELQ